MLPAPNHDTADVFVSTSRWLYVTAELTRMERKFELEGGSAHARALLVGRATIAPDHISIPTEPTKVECELAFSMEAASDKRDRGAWSLNVGYNPARSDLGMDDEWFVAFYVPSDIFDQLRDDFLIRNARFVSGACTTNMRTSKHDAEAALAQGITWLLRSNESGRPKLAAGEMTMLRWSLTSVELRAQNPYHR